MKKILIYGIIAFVLVAIAAVAAFLLTSPSDSQDGQQNPVGTLFGSLFPFGSGGGSAAEQPLLEGEDAGDNLSVGAPRLRKVSESPVSGGFLFTREGVPMIRFVDRSSGHVYETEADSITVTRITNTTIPGIQEVMWVDENHFMIRYLEGEKINTFFASLDEKTEGEQSLSGFFIDSFTRGALDSERKNLFSVFTNQTGASLVLSDPDGESSRAILNTPLRSLVPLQSDDGLFVYTAPASGVNGFVYQVVGGSLVKIVGDVAGLTAKISADSSRVLVSGGGENVIGLALAGVKEGTLTDAPVDTLSAKCVFTPSASTLVLCGVPRDVPDGEYPNDWLLGRVSFSDSLWRINFESESATLVEDLAETAGEAIDVWQPSMSPDESYLLFMNKKDLSLWSYRLPETGIPEEGFNL